LIKLSNSNENFQEENAKMTKQISRLIELLKSKDICLKIYQENENFIKKFDPEKKRKFQKIFFNLILLKKKRLRIYFRIWVLANIKKINVKTMNNSLIFRQFSFYIKAKPENSIYIICDLSSFSLSSLNRGFSRDKLKLNNCENIIFPNSNSSKSQAISFIDTIIRIHKYLKKEHMIYFYMQLMKKYFFCLIKHKMITFKNILTKLKLKNTINKQSNYSQKILYKNFLKFKFNTPCRLINHSKFSQLSIDSKTNHLEHIYKKNKSNRFSILLLKSLIWDFMSHLSKRKYLYRWLMNNQADKLIQKNKSIEFYIKKETDFTSKLGLIEETYEKSFESILTEKKKLEINLHHCQEQLDEYKKRFAKSIEEQNIVSLTKKKEEVSLVEMKNKFLLLSEKYESEMIGLKNENLELKENFSNLESNYKEMKNEKVSLEKKLLNVITTNETLKQELEDFICKYEKLKNLSAESTKELVKISNEIAKIKSENKAFYEENQSLIESNEKLNNEINSKERNIRLLKSNEDNLIHQSQLDKEKLESKFWNDKNILNQKIENVEKEKDSLQEEVKKLNREIKNQNEKLKSYTDYISLKKEVLHLRSKICDIENENTNTKLININQQKRIENLVESYNTEKNKYEVTKTEVRFPLLS
jgi:hypothetical protein